MTLHDLLNKRSVEGWRYDILGSFVFGKWTNGRASGQSINARRKTGSIRCDVSGNTEDTVTDEILEVPVTGNIRALGKRTGTTGKIIYKMF